MDCVKKIPDMLILVIVLPPAMLFLILTKKIPDMLISVPHLPQAMPLGINNEKFYRDLYNILF